MSAVRRAGLELVHPQAVEPQLSAWPKVHRQFAGERGHVPVEPALQVAEYAGAGRQVIQRGIGRIAAIGVGAAPGLAGLVLVVEAGGRVNDFLAGDGLLKGNPIFASAPGIAQELAQVVGCPLPA